METGVGDRESQPLREILACPVCTATKLVSKSDERLKRYLACTRCGGVFPVRHSCPELLDLEIYFRLPLYLFAAWHITQGRALSHYESNDAASCSLIHRDDVQAFRRFMSLSGRLVVDVGSGSFALPGYADGRDYYADNRGYRTFVGIDPIPPNKRPHFPLLVALGERLPFADDSVDSVILATSLDHALDIPTTLREIRRVLRDDGDVYFWGMFVDEHRLGRGIEVPRLARVTREFVAPGDPVASYLKLRNAYDELVDRVQSSAGTFAAQLVDDFHFRHLSRPELLRVMLSVGFVASNEETYESEAGGQHSFIRFVKGSSEQLIAAEIADRSGSHISAAPAGEAGQGRDWIESERLQLAALIRRRDERDGQVVTELRAVREGLDRLLLAQLSTPTRRPSLASRIRVRLVMSVARPRRAIRRGILGLHHASVMAGPLLRVRVARRRPAATGKRVLMLTIGQIAHDPRINKVAKSLAEHGYEVEIMAPSERETPEELEVAPRVRYRLIPRDARWKLFLIYQREFLKAAEELQFDLVHANDLTTLAVGAILAQRRDLPLVYDAHELWAENVEFDGSDWVPMSERTRRRATRWERWLLTAVDLLVTVGPSIQQEYERRYELKMQPLLLPNYPSRELLAAKARRDLRDECDLDESAFVTLYMGGVNPLRNIETVIAAHRHLPDHHVFVVIGPGVEHYAPHYEELAEAEGVGDRVFFLDPVGMDEVVDIAQQADCGIVMLRNICKNFYWFFPNKLFEYAMAGIPVAVSNFPDVTAFVTEERCGVTFDPESPESIAAALQALAEDRSAAREMGERGRATILEHRNWETAVRPLLGSYDDLVR